MGSCVSGQKVTQDREEPNAKRQSLLNADRIGDDPEGNVYSQDEDDALPGGMENEHPRSPMKQAKQVKTKDNSRCVHKKTVLDVFLDQKKATPASELAKLIELSRSQEYNSLRYGTAPLSLTSPHIAGILNGIKSSIDAVLYPILTASLDTVREEAEQNADDVSLQEISSAIASAVKTQIPSETAFQAGIQAGLFCVGWLAHGTPRYEPSSEVACCHYTDYYVASVNHLFSCTKNTLVQPSAGLMSSYQLDEGLEHLAVILHKMGVVHSESSWQAALPMFALDAITKGALLYIECNKNQKRLSLNPVRRHMVITDGSVLAKAAGLWSGVPSGALRQGGWAKHERVKQEHLKIFPAFEGSDGVIEYGEGHGPRKELFDLIAAAVTSPWSPEADLGKKCNGTLKAGSVTAFIAVTEGQDVTIPQWSMLVFGTPDGPFEAEVNKTERNKDVLKITLSKEAPVSCEAMPLALKLRVTPLFQGDSSGYWFREVEGLGMAETGDLTQDQLATLDMYGFTGWLLSQTIGNGVTMNLALPVIFYTMLKAWPNWDPTLQPLSALAPDIAASLSAIKALPHADFKEVLEVDGLPPTSKDEYIQKRIVDYLKNDIKNQMAAFAYGFCLTGVRQLPAFTACRPEELRLVLQGRGDDGVADFRFHEEFHILESQDFREGEHNKVFKEVLWEVIESGLGAEKGQVAVRKRQFVKFLTGRHMLPAHPRQETLSIVVPYTMLAAKEFTAYLTRLPASHTCDNTLEIPNYMESLLFRPSSIWYKKAGVKVGDTITFQLKGSCWGVLNASEQAQIRKELTGVLQDKLTTAVLNSDSYELDFIDQESEAKGSPYVPPALAPTPPLEEEDTVEEEKEEEEDKIEEEKVEKVESTREVTPEPSPPLKPLLTPFRRLSTPGSRPVPLPIQKFSMLEDTQGAACKPLSEMKVAKKPFVDITSGDNLHVTKQSAVTDTGDPWDTEDLDALLKKLQENF